MKRIFVLMTLLISYFTPAFVNADNDICVQYLPEYMPQAPSAQAIARAIDIPVDYYTGLPNISIPLYTIQVGSLSVPITLSYQGGGIKPSQEATCVGLGWNLNVGGTITRTVKCADDFLEYNLPESQFTHGYFDRSEMIDMTIEPDPNYYHRSPRVQIGTDMSTYYDILYADSEPDIFFYSLPSGSGKFIFKKDQSVVYFDKSKNVEIRPLLGSTPRPLFNATDNQGTLYKFGEKERTHIYSGTIGQNGNVNTTNGGIDISVPSSYSGLHEVSDYTSSWFLTEMVSASNDTIDFEYEDESFMLPIQETCFHRSKIGGEYVNISDGTFYISNKTEVESKRLTRISWRGGYAEFNYESVRSDLIKTYYQSGDPKMLTDIKVYTDRGVLVCHWRMTYAYFNNDTQAAKKYLFKRLKLCSLKNMLTEQLPYTFTYNETHALPVKNTKNIDYWGYYNGSSQGREYYCTASNTFAPSQKTPDEEYCKAGVLVSMDQPTGGTTDFEWEINRIGENVGYTSNEDVLHDSYTKGRLQTCQGGDSSLKPSQTQAVILNEQTELYLLLSSKYVGSQSCPTDGGTPFLIEKVNQQGSNTLCYSWSVTSIGDEVEQTIVLPQGVYEFKCSSPVADVVYSMYYIDSMNKGTLKKVNEETMYCSNVPAYALPLSDTRTLTLDNRHILYFHYSNPCPVGVVETTGSHPFSVSRVNANGSKELISAWTTADCMEEEYMSICLESGTYEVKCEALIDEVISVLSYSYGEPDYTPNDFDYYSRHWDSGLKMSYSEGLAPNSYNLPEEESDTIVLAGAVQMYFNLFYDNTAVAVNPQSFSSTRPLEVYKENLQGAYEKIYDIPAACFADIEWGFGEAVGLRLEAGTYIIRCKASVDDVVFGVQYAYHLTEGVSVANSGGDRRGGLRIKRISGEKEVTYLYEDGKDMIQPCTHYSEAHYYYYTGDEYYWQGVVRYGVFDVKTSESVRALSTLKNGNTTGYSKVVEIFNDDSRKEYTYYNEEEELQNPDFPYSPTYIDWQNGLLQSEIHFDADGDTVLFKQFAYNRVETTNNYTAGFIDVGNLSIHEYEQRVECPLLSHVKTTEHRDNGKLVTRQTFAYNENLLCKEETTQIGNDVHKTTRKYASDFSDEVSELMVATNLVGVPVAELHSRNGIIYDGARTIYANFNQLTDNGNTVICGTRSWDDETFCEMYLPKYLLTLNTSNTATDFSSCHFDTAVVYNSYTKYGNVRELCYKSTPVTYLWGYKGTCPLAEIRNTTYQQFMNSFGAGNLDKLSYYEDPEYIRDVIWQTCKGLDNTSVTIAFYKPLVGPSELTDNRGVIHTYSYDAAGRVASDNLMNVSSTLYEVNQRFSYDYNKVASIVYPSIESSSSIRSVQFYDEWGRPSIYATQGCNPNGLYSYSMQKYDSFGRLSHSYVPVPSNNSVGEYMDKETIKGLSSSAFSGDYYGFVRTFYDAMDREVETTVPGLAWASNNKTTSSQYLISLSSDVKKYCVSGNLVSQTGYYPSGQLDCVLTTDPDGHTVKTYKDVFGNVVLERRAENYDTYYVYDDLNRLRFVLPPKYQQEPNLGYYAYQYEYDGRGRVVKKTLPGCSPVQYWYDSKDRCIKMQDGILAQSGKYRVWTYDTLDRVLTQAIEGPGGQHQDELRNFYDNYNFLSTFSSQFPINVNSQMSAYTLYGNGQLTGNWQVTNDGGSVISVIGYDDMGYPAKNIVLNPERFLSVSTYTNNLAGNIVEEGFSVYTKSGGGNVFSETAHGRIENNYTYPHTNLLTSSVITIYDKNGNMRKDTILHLTYDAFGNIAANNRSGSAADMSYSYDQMHGWLTGIRSACGFEQKLYRETEGNIPCYSGNISAMTWKTGNNYLRRYDYRYNSMNWLKNADFSYYSITGGTSLSPTLSLIPYVGMDHEDYTCEYYYDKNGNITGVYRQGLVGDLGYGSGLDYDTMDDFNIVYHGNQKTAVNGTGTGTPSYYGSSSFVDGVENGANEYAYDANGAMTKDLNKGISSISYDLLGNLKKITLSGNRDVSYAYAADGTRLKSVHTRKAGNVYVKDSTEYCGNLILKNGSPSMFLFAGGYYSFSNSLLGGCHYYIQDYLGSNRMVVNKTGGVEQVTHYYPYGGVIGGIDNSPNFQPYKFEGMELDRTYGLDWYDIHARQYDPVVPSWHKVDPLAEKYYWLSPYAYCGNNPVNAVDVDGKDIYIQYKDNQGKFQTYLFKGFHGKAITIPKNQFVKDVITAYLYNSSDGVINNMIKAATSSKYKIFVRDATDPDVMETPSTKYFRDSGKHIISWQSRKGLRTTSGGRQSAATALEHEFDHAVNYVDDPSHISRVKSRNNKYETEEEKRVIEGSEYRTALSHGESTRDSHEGDMFDTESPISIEEKKW